MTARLIVAPGSEPVSLAEMKLWLRVDTPDEDALVSALIAAARATIEREARRALITQTWRISLDAWPAGPVVPLPLGPVVTVAAVRVYPAAGPAIIVPVEDYRLDPAGDPARLFLRAPMPEPGILGGGIEIDFVCGYGPDPADVPEPLKLAIRMAVARWYEHRGDDAPDVRALPAEIAPLVARYRRPRI